MTRLLQPLAALLLTAAGVAGCRIDRAIFATAADYASASPDARLDGIGHPVAGPQAESTVGSRAPGGPPAIVNPDDRRFEPTPAAAVLLLPGRDRLDDYVVLGAVSSGDTGGVGTRPDLTAESLRLAAAALGADAILDVRATGSNHLEGLAARRRQVP